MIGLDWIGYNSILHPAFYILHPSSNILHQASYILSYPKKCLSLQDCRFNTKHLSITWMGENMTEVGFDFHMTYIHFSVLVFILIKMTYNVHLVNKRNSQISVARFMYECSMQQLLYKYTSIKLSVICLHTCRLSTGSNTDRLCPCICIWIFNK